MEPIDNNKEKILEKLYNLALRFLSFRPRSQKEVYSYLLKKLKKNYHKRSVPAHHLSQSEIQDLVKGVFSRLSKQNLVNDEEFVDWWIEQRLEFNPKGKRAIKQELFQKGISKSLIEEKLAKIDSHKLTLAAKKILQKKKNLYLDLKPLELKKKLIYHLLSRGFDYNLSRQLVDDFL